VSGRLLAVAASVVLAALSLAGCTSNAAANRPTAPLTPPNLGDCRVLTLQAIALPSNQTPPVSCAQAHTAETFAVGSFPKRLAKGTDAKDPALGSYIYRRCQKDFKRFLGANDTLVMRTTLTWAWFRPPPASWARGARWWRCDVVGGGTDSATLENLPKTAKGLLLGVPDDQWMICANGPTVSGSVKIPCSHKHVWRAVTTVVLGKPGDSYPGDRIVEVRTRDFCSQSVGAWLNYPIKYDFGYSWFHKAEWKAGNRRSVCWARTTQ
jgi:hypothetical protein